MKRLLWLIYCQKSKQEIIMQKLNHNRINDKKKPAK